MMGGPSDFSHIPIIDVSELVTAGPSRRAIAERLGEACRHSGIFYVVGHGVDGLFGPLAFFVIDARMEGYSEFRGNASRAPLAALAVFLLGRASLIHRHSVSLAF
jgi:hypothetical protein